MSQEQSKELSSLKSFIDYQFEKREAPLAIWMYDARKTECGTQEYGGIFSFDNEVVVVKVETLSKEEAKKRGLPS